jgi:RimJ/RimL family protein N-acetyltransferase
MILFVSAAPASKKGRTDRFFGRCCRGATTPQDARSVIQAMQRQNNSAPSIVLADSPYLVRTMTAADATDRWARWFSDPHVRYMLNSPTTQWTREAVVNYINHFDQTSNLLFGIFESRRGLLVGILTAKVNRGTRQALIAAVVGEPGYRHMGGVMSAVCVPFFDYLFDTLKLKMILASALKRNEIVVKMMLKRGWKLDQTLENYVKSNADSTMLDLCLLSLTRGAYRAWKKTR